MKKALRKLIPALVMLLIAAAFVGTSTYAWFSMNRIVDVTGMSVTTKVEDSLLIASANAEANYVKTLSQTRVGKLRPVSTVDGVSFYYTNPANVKGDGDAATDTYVAYSEAETQSGEPLAVDNALENTNAGKTNYDKAFQTAYGIDKATTITTSNVLYGYIDYVFYIKATNTTDAAEDLKLTKLNLLYNNAAIDTEKAWRVAVFAQAAEKNTDLSTAFTASDRKAMLTLASAANRTANEAVNSTSGTGTVTYTSAAWAVDSIAKGATEYNKVTVRLWLEGEDTTCDNDTFAQLTDAYTLDVEFRLGGSENAVTVIGSVVPNP